MMTMRSKKRVRADSGFTLIESMVAMVVMVIGLLGLASLQVVGVRANYFGKKMATASTLAHDLAENIDRWDYNDSRLAVPAGRTLVTSTSTIAGWTMGTGATAAYTADYGEQAGDSNAANPGQLATNYAGLLEANVEYSTATNFPATRLMRYWNVYPVDLAGTGSPQGKLVQIIVRWREGSSGLFRQTTASVFRANPAAMLQ